MSADLQTCSTLLPANQKPNCLSTYDTGKCVACSSGYRMVNEDCVVYAHKGCKTSTGDKCDECDDVQNYYAVDVGAMNSQVCQYYSVILKVATLMVTLVALL